MPESVVLVPAAQYVRMSTERQEYSLDNQFAFIAKYAEQNGFVICQTYCDEARSGLVIKNRAGLSRLLQDVAAGKQQYKAVLVYDVSRWGRFQDPDEAAHYEFLCKAADVAVHYCAEPFANDRHLPNIILKTLKRIMAAEYSRELSERVFAGMIRLVREGYSTGAFPGYGLRRMLLGPNRTPKHQLAKGEHKNIKTDRVVLVPGPAEEVFWVGEIYRMFITERRTFAGIAQILNQKNVPFIESKKWTDYNVKKILTHPKYKGSAVYNRNSERLRSKSRALPKSEWIVVPNAFEPVIQPEVFDAAQEVWRNKAWNRTNENFLAMLKALLQRHGYLSSSLISREAGGPRASTLWRRFGSLRMAYELIGYQTPYQKMARHRLEVYKLRRELMQQLTKLFPGKVSILNPSGSLLTCLRLGNGSRVSVRLCRSIVLPARGRVWALQKENEMRCRITLLVGMNDENASFEKFYLLPRIRNSARIHLSPSGSWCREAISLPILESFYERVCSIGRVAAITIPVEER